MRRKSVALSEADKSLRVLNIFTRVYTTQLQPTLTFYEQLLSRQASMKFRHERLQLELATVGNILIVAGTEDALDAVRRTSATMLVDDLDATADFLSKAGAEVLDGPNDVPTGKNLRVRHPDGLVVEYVEFSRG